MKVKKESQDLSLPGPPIVLQDVIIFSLLFEQDKLYVQPWLLLNYICFCSQGMSIEDIKKAFPIPMGPPGAAVSVSLIALWIQTSLSNNQHKKAGFSCIYITLTFSSYVCVCMFLCL